MRRLLELQLLCDAAVDLAFIFCDVLLQPLRDQVLVDLRRVPADLLLDLAADVVEVALGQSQPLLSRCLVLVV